MNSRPLIEDKSSLLLLAEEVGIVETRIVDGVPLISDISSGAEKISGYLKEEVIGKPVTIFHTEEDIQFTLPLIFAKFQKDRQPYTSELEIVTKSGELLPVHIHGVPIFENDELVGTISFSFDISEYVKHRSRLVDINHKLEKIVQQETDKRVHSERVIFEQKKFADMGQMIGAIAHQWRQPLNSLSLQVQDVKDAFEFDELDKNFINNFEQEALTLISYMSDTIEDFRNFFMPERTSSKFDFAATVIDTLKLFRAQLAAKDIKFSIGCKCAGTCDVVVEEIVAPPCGIEGAKVKGSSGEFKQAVMNIITNSIDAIEERKTKEHNLHGSLKIHFLKADSFLYVTFEDNGGGIPDKVMQKLFDPYFTTKENGTGIGLYMTKSIIEEKFKGELIVENTCCGASFTIKVPHKS